MLTETSTTLLERSLKGEGMNVATTTNPNRIAHNTDRESFGKASLSPMKMATMNLKTIFKA